MTTYPGDATDEVRKAAVPTSDSRPARARVVRCIGRLPFQGRHGTLRLIRLCHDAVSEEDVRLARSRLRHAMVMNAVRHVAPLPPAAVAVCGWATLARQRESVLALPACVAAAATAVLAVAGGLAAYAQTSIHLSLSRGLRRPPGQWRQERNLRESRRPAGSTSSQVRRDRVVTRILVVTAVCLVPGGVGIEAVTLLGLRIG